MPPKNSVPMICHVERLVHGTIPLSNAIRHGHASRIFINFKKVDIWLVIRIRNNGIGCKDIHKGFGLTHMKERVDMLHGTVTYSSNNGFQVVAKLPIRWRNEER
mgnify:CR=1 FL=1